MPVVTVDPPARLSPATPPGAAGVRQVWLADALRWCRRNQVPASVPALRRTAVVAAGLVLVGGGAVLVGVAVLVVVVVGAVTGRPGDVRGLLPWLLLASAARSVLLGVLPVRRAAIACPADAEALDVLGLSRASVWRARVLLPGLAGAAGTSALAVAVAVAAGVTTAPAPLGGLLGWCLLPVPASVLGSQLGALLSRSGRELPGWVWAAPALLLGLVLGDQLGRWFATPPSWDDATVLALVGLVTSSGAALAPVGWPVLAVTAVASALPLRPVDRELRRPWARALDRPQRTVRSVLTTELRRGRRLATRVHRRLADGLVLLGALVAGLAATVPWPVGPADPVPLLVGAAATASLLVAVSLVASQGPLVHADTLRWLVDAGLDPRRVVDRHLRESVRITLVPGCVLGVALGVVGRSWWLVPVTVLLAVGVLLAATWADLADPTREPQPDGTSESGVVAGLLTVLASGLLVAPWTVLPPPAALPLQVVATAAVAVLVRRRLLTEIAGHAAPTPPPAGRRPHPKEQ